MWPRPPAAVAPRARAPRGELLERGGLRGWGAARIGGAVAGRARPPRRVTNLMKREALADFRARTAVHAQALGKPVPHVSLFDAGGRWGSCTPARRTIRYSWRVIAAPPWVLDYLSAHETAHLVEPNHSAKFWALVGRLHGDPQRARDWFHRHGPALQALGRQVPAAT